MNLTTGLATAIGDPTVGTGCASISGLAFSGSTLPSVSVPEPSSVILPLSGIAGPAGPGMLRKLRARRAA